MDTAEIYTDLQQTFQGWSFWRARDSEGKLASWWANRERLLTEKEMSQGLHHTLAADTLEELRALLEDQTRLEHNTLGPAR